jgi:hypothetical protein
VACAVLVIICGFSVITASPIIKRFSDASSDYNVEREVRQTVAWIKDHLYKARTLRHNLRFDLYNDPAMSEIKATPDFIDAPYDKMYGEVIAFRASTEGETVLHRFTYDYLHQTLSPGVEIRVLKKNDAGYEVTDWVIRLSGFGMVSLFRGGTPK